MPRFVETSLNIIYSYEWRKLLWLFAFTTLTQTNNPLLIYGFVVFFSNFSLCVSWLILFYFFLFFSFHRLFPTHIHKTKYFGYALNKLYPSNKNLLNTTAHIVSCILHPENSIILKPNKINPFGSNPHPYWNLHIVPAITRIGCIHSNRLMVWPALENTLLAQSHRLPAMQAYSLNNMHIRDIYQTHTCYAKHF